MTVRLNTALRNQLADSMGDTFNSGLLEIRTGAQPASAGDTATGTLLASIPLPADAFSAASTGVASKSGTWSVAASATGTAGWARFRNTGDTLHMDGAVTATGGGGDLTIDNVSIVATGTVTVTSFTITQPAQ
jgi:hypothetical protein